jgi:hypothetical protein
MRLLLLLSYSTENLLTEILYTGQDYSPQAVCFRNIVMTRTILTNAIDTASDQTLGELSLERRLKLLVCASKVGYTGFTGTDLP